VTKYALKAWRNNNGYSQSQLAKVLGVSTITVSRWERGDGKVPPFLHLVLKYLKKRGGEIRIGRPPKEAVQMGIKKKKGVAPKK
jgi:transcriptional regulator with XRE-family HTH domain